MQAYSLTSTVDIETPTTTNTSGETSETWTVVARGVPAEVKARESLTKTEAAGLKALTSHRVRMRPRSDVDSLCRLKLGDRVLNILGPPRRVPEARPRALVMECMEVES